MAETIYRATADLPGQQYVFLYTYEPTAKQVIEELTELVGEIHITDVFPILGEMPAANNLSEATIKLMIDPLLDDSKIIDTPLTAKAEEGEAFFPKGCSIRFVDTFSILAEQIESPTIIIKRG